MFRQYKQLFLGLTLLFSSVFFSAYASTSIEALPAGFVYLREIAPSIIQNIRYAGHHNFVGRPIKGYHAPVCILTESAAFALARVQIELLQSRLSLKVFDCYRPTMAVADFYAWSTKPDQQKMKAEFYPNIDKRDFFELGYIAKQSGHSRGSTVDLTIVPIGVALQHYAIGQTLVACTEVANRRFFDGGLDFGTGYDCMDERSHIDNTDVSLVAQSNRQMLLNLMTKHGFKSYEKEWWHFTLEDEPFPERYFNFEVK